MWRSFCHCLLDIAQMFTFFFFRSTSYIFTAKITAIYALTYFLQNPRVIIIIYIKVISQPFSNLHIPILRLPISSTDNNVIFLNLFSVELRRHSEFHSRSLLCQLTKSLSIIETVLHKEIPDLAPRYKLTHPLIFLIFHPGSCYNILVPSQLFTVFFLLTTFRLNLGKNGLLGFFFLLFKINLIAYPYYSHLSDYYSIALEYYYYKVL